MDHFQFREGKREFPSDVGCFWANGGVNPMKRMIIATVDMSHGSCITKNLKHAALVVGPRFLLA